MIPLDTTRAIERIKQILNDSVSEIEQVLGDLFDSAYEKGYADAERELKKE